VVAAVDGRATWLAIVAMLSSVVAAYLYLRIIVSMYVGAPADAAAKRLRIPAGARAALAVCLLVTVGAGLLPDKFTKLAGDAKPVLVNLPEAPGAATPTPDPGAQLGAPTDR
jgi:NADH-quinone oxidoreductase subunit N